MVAQGRKVKAETKRDSLRVRSSTQEAMILQETSACDSVDLEF